MEGGAMLLPLPLLAPFKHLLLPVICKTIPLPNALVSLVLRKQQKFLFCTGSVWKIIWNYISVWLQCFKYGLERHRLAFTSNPEPFVLNTLLDLFFWWREEKHQLQGMLLLPSSQGWTGIRWTNIGYFYWSTKKSILHYTGIYTILECCLLFPILPK